jgi:hypothetical protein
MAESETAEIDFFPSVWREEIHDDSYIEWIYEQDETILVRLDGTGGKGNYTVYPITGVNSDGEEFITRPISRLSREQAFEVTVTLLYAMNGVIGRVNDNNQFCGDK